MNNRIKIILSFVLGVVIALLSVVFFGKIQEAQFNKKELNLDVSKLIEKFSSKLSISSNSKYERFDEILNILQKEYRSGSMIKTGKMLMSAKKSLVNAIGDPFTNYMDGEENKELSEALQGSSDFEGIGAYITKKDNGIEIEEVIKDSPAYKAGLKMFDTIVQVDGKSVLDLTIGEGVKLIRGPKGTKVELTIIRKNKDGKSEIIKKEVIRDVVNIPSVKGKLFSGNIGYIAISSIGETTSTLFEKEAKLLKKQGMNKLILDLRGNGGGILDVAVDILSYFIPKGEIIVSAKYRVYPDQDYKSKGYGLLENIPIVVLVDGMTASAGEIIAMALVERDNAKLVGTKTFGKGTIQTIHPFDDGSSLKYTIGKRYSPNGENIHGTGYFTGKELAFDRTGYVDNNIDNQLEFAKTFLLNKDK